MTAPILRFLAAAERWPDRTALTDEAGEWSYAGLADRAKALAVGLRERLGDDPETLVAIAAKNHGAHVVAMFGVFLAGYAWLPLNPRSARAQNDEIVGALKPELILRDEACAECVGEGAAPIIAFDGRGGGLEALAGEAAAFTPPSLTDDHVMCVKLTGGTTGRPKAVAQTQRVIATVIDDLSAVFRICGEDVNLAVAPLSHGAFHLLLPVLIAGGRHEIVAQADPGELLDRMARRGVTLAFMPPTLIVKLAGSGLADPSRFPALRELIYSAAPMQPDQIRRAQAAFGPKIAVMYGQVEAPMAIAAMASRDMTDDTLQSVGAACPSAEIRIDADTPGDTGEILVRGPVVAPGYLTGEPAALEDGWLRTGDLGCLDEDGVLSIRGRAKEMIISGGFNIYPAEVERALLTIEAVEEACVFGVVDPYWGERVEAAVVAGAGVSDDCLGLAVREAIGAVAAPKAFHRVEALPRNPVGKVVRREVAALFSPPSGEA